MLDVRDIPLLRLRLDGQDLPPGEPAAIVALRIQRAMSAPALCEITLTTDSFTTAFTIGRHVAVSLAVDRAQLFAGQITAVTLQRSGDGTRTVRLRAHDPLDALRHRDAPQSFTDMSTRQIAARLAADHGLALAPGDDGPRWPHLMQTDLSDLALLRQICARSGLWFCWQANALHLRPLAPASTPAPPRRLPVEDGVLLRCSVTTNALAQRARVETEGWDSATGALHRATTASALDMRLADAPPRTRTESQTGAPDHAALTAGAAARQHRRDLAAHFLRASFVGPVPLALGESVVLIDGEAPLCDPRPVTAITHTLDSEQGFVTEITTEPPEDAATGTAPDAVPRVHPATVIGVADPARLGRVQVTLDAAAGVQSGWLRVVLPAAGPDKGLIALPDVGDRVVLLQTGPTPEQALVIGGLIGPARRDMGVAGRSVKQYLFTTSDGQKLVLDDTDHSALVVTRDGARIRLGPKETRIEAANGSFVSLGNRATVIHSETDLTLRAPGRDMVIGAASVDFKKL